MMKKNYKAPEIEIIELEKIDIIQTSGEPQSLDVNSIESSVKSSFNEVKTANESMGMFE